jgi:hypothetical protein
MRRARAAGWRRWRGCPRTVGAGDLQGRALSERRQRELDRPIGVDAAGDQLLVVLRNVLRQLVDDVHFARRVDRQPAEPRAHE